MCLLLPIAAETVGSAIALCRLLPAEAAVPIDWVIAHSALVLFGFYLLSRLAIWEMPTHCTEGSSSVGEPRAWHPQ